MNTRKLSELVLDYSVYPRREIDRYHANAILEALKGGAELPPLVICAKTLRIADGFHRHSAYKRFSDDNPEFEVQVVEKDYKNDAELFLDSMRYNACHGRTLTRFDKTHCVLVAKKLHVSDKDIARILHVPTKEIKQILQVRSALKPGTTQELTAIKTTIKHKAGQRLTPEQEQCNDKLGGMNQAFYVNQVIMLLENDLVDWDDEKLVEKLQKLNELLDQALAGMAR